VHICLLRAAGASARRGRSGGVHGRPGGHRRHPRGRRRAVAGVTGGRRGGDGGGVGHLWQASRRWSPCGAGASCEEGDGPAATPPHGESEGNPHTAGQPQRHADPCRRRWPAARDPETDDRGRQRACGGHDLRGRWCRRGRRERRAAGGRHRPPGGRRGARHRCTGHGAGRRPRRRGGRRGGGGGAARPGGHAGRDLADLRHTPGGRQDTGLADWSRCRRGRRHPDGPQAGGDSHEGGDPAGGCATPAEEAGTGR
jgi:hypothetical protein